MDEYIYEIKNLICSYNNKWDVLKISNLNIPRGKITVLLGISGSGKSTILETLGLMNNTIKNGSELFFHMNGNSRDFGFIWDQYKDDEIADIRMKHFSFIFQDTNLMPNFDAYENIGITLMLQGFSKKEAIEKSKILADQMDLFINEEKKSFELSGGEKQRSAFIRAIAPKFDVLFGDEPTGNLDDENSQKLMRILKEKINTENRTAIIVSHNIELALEFADQIVVLKKVITNGDQGYGIVPEKNIFNSTNIGGKQIWYNSQNKEITKKMKAIIKKSMIEKL